MLRTTMFLIGSFLGLAACHATDGIVTFRDPVDGHEMEGRATLMQITSIEAKRNEAGLIRVWQVVAQEVNDRGEFSDRTLTFNLPDSDIVYHTPADFEVRISPKRLQAGENLAIHIRKEKAAQDGRLVWRDYAAGVFAPQSFQSRQP